MPETGPGMTTMPSANPMAKTTASGFMGPLWRAQRLRRDELQCHAVVAVAKVCRGRSVVEHVALVTQAPGAVVFGARQADLQVRLPAERAAEGGVEAGPA